MRSGRAVTSRLGVRGLMSFLRRATTQQEQGNKQETEVKTKPVCNVSLLIDIFRFQSYKKKLTDEM